MNLKETKLFSVPIAHRGLHDETAPENSLLAFDKAIQNGYCIEMDVRLIDDGTVIVFHDDKLARVTGADGYASTLKRADLKNIRLGGTDEKIPTFEQFLSEVNGKTPILVEIKNEGKVGELERKTLEMLASYSGEYAVQSFNPYSIEYFKTHAPDVTRGILSCYFENVNLAWYKKWILKRLKLNNVAKPNFISYEFHRLPNKYVSRAALPTLAWTLHSNTETENVLPHCDNIIFEGFIPKIDK
jgi:glycerophosphoryl diester phosphodiesterase